MNVETAGVQVWLERLPAETQAQLEERKAYVFHEPFEPSRLAARVALSKFFHYVRFKGVRYSDEIHRQLG